MTYTNDPYNLSRFISAQNNNNNNSYAEALYEIKNGAKLSHCMWYVFPQLDGLGSSTMCKKYSIKSIDEAKAYLDHPILNKRLIDITIAAVNALPRFNENLISLFGDTDAIKFRSSMTLFFYAASNEHEKFIFSSAIFRACNGKMCHKTEELLNIETSPDHENVQPAQVFDNLKWFHRDYVDSINAKEPIFINNTNYENLVPKAIR